MWPRRLSRIAAFPTLPNPIPSPASSQTTHPHFLQIKNITGILLYFSVLILSKQSQYITVGVIALDVKAKAKSNNAYCDKPNIFHKILNDTMLRLCVALVS